MTDTIAHALEEFAQLIDTQRYFEAHEILEAVWIEAKKRNHPQTLLLKGLINAAVAFEHLKRNRSNALASSRITIQAYLRYKEHLCLESDNYLDYKKVCDRIEQHPYWHTLVLIFWDWVQWIPPPIFKKQL